MVPGQRQKLAWQYWVPTQGFPHPPQLEKSLEVSVQLPLQSCCGAGQGPMHWPIEHFSPLSMSQAWPHVPQFCWSQLRSTQGPLGHWCIGGWQTVVHLRFWHEEPAPQTMPQPPQFSGSLSRSAQTLPQIFAPGCMQ